MSVYGSPYAQSWTCVPWVSDPSSEYLILALTSETEAARHAKWLHPYLLWDLELLVLQNLMG